MFRNFKCFPGYWEDNTKYFTAKGYRDAARSAHIYQNIDNHRYQKKALLVVAMSVKTLYKTATTTNTLVS